MSLRGGADLREGRISGLVRRLAALGTLPSEPEDDRLRKGSMVLASCLVTVLSIDWVVTYFVLHQPLSAAIPLTYQLGSLAGLAWLFRTKRFEGFRLSQLLMMLVLPALLQMTLGGFVTSSAVVLWASFAPLGALMFFGVRRSMPWFAAYAVELMALGLLDAHLQGPDIPRAVVVAFFVQNVIGVSFTSYAILGYFVRERERSHSALTAERERSERLLLNILPGPIAERLKDDAGIIAEHFDEVTVLFADIVGFTKRTESMHPQDLVAMLDELFSAFDDLAVERGLEKIKTIGDAYMVAGGLPTPRPDHAEAIAEMALGMRERLATISRNRDDPERLSIRIGIDTGAVVAGVIGRRKFIYDLWGDTVNTASRMESQGVPDAIQTTARTYERLRDAYAFEPRGSIELKGKGPMDAYLLLGRRD